jgi:hypothetical protein
MGSERGLRDGKKELEQIKEEQRERCGGDEKDLECLRKGWAFQDQEEMY